TGLRTIPLPLDGVLRIGRHPDSDLVIASASPQHAEIHGGEPPEIEDLQGSHGTRVGGSRIVPGRRILLAPGSMIQIGDTLLNVRREGGAPRGETRDARPARAMGVKAEALATDPKLLEVYRLAERLADSTIAVLVLGETGAGKQLVAERIHA